MVNLQAHLPGGLLPSDLEDALRDNPKPEAVDNLFAFCHTMATAYVRTKTVRGVFHPSRLGMNVRDFALDAIAELFRQDRGESLAAFKILKCASTDSAHRLAMHHQLRQIVFGAVNQHIFKSFHFSDPPLARLIRNIKETIATMKNCQGVKLRESLHIAPRVSDLLLDQPLFPEELLNIEFGNRTSGTFTLREHLNCIVGILLDQSAYRRTYPVTGLALLVKPMLKDPECSETAPPSITDSISEQEVRASIDGVIDGISRTLLQNYLIAKKLKPKEVNAYKRALEEVLVRLYVYGDGRDINFYSVVSKFLGGVRKLEYMQTHRPKFEYAVKKAKNALRVEWKSELEFCGGSRSRRYSK